MDVGLFGQGMVIGLAVAAPVGPIGVLCIRRTLAEGRASGVASGLGAALADAVYGSIAALGLTAVTDVLVGGEAWLRLLGGSFLVFLGMRTFLTRPAERAAAVGRGGLLSACLSTFLLTLANPATILSFAAIFAALGAASAPDNAFDAMSLVLGVFLGSTLWWITLSGAAGVFHSKLSVGGLRWVNRVSGTVLAVLGVLAVSGAGG